MDMKQLSLIHILGLGDLAVQESKMRIKGALSGIGISVSGQRLTVNLAPADVRKCGSLYDFTIIAAILAVNNIITDDLSDCAFIGEVSLGGSLVFTGGIISMAIEAKKCGIKRLFLPAENAKEASVVEGLSVYGISHISDLINPVSYTHLRHLWNVRICVKSWRTTSATL